MEVQLYRSVVDLSTYYRVWELHDGRMFYATGKALPIASLEERYTMALALSINVQQQILEYDNEKNPWLQEFDLTP